MRHAKWSVFEAHVTDDGLAHVAPVDTETLGIKQPHVLAQHCVCSPRTQGRVVVHEMMSERCADAIRRKAWLTQ